MDLSKEDKHILDERSDNYSNVLNSKLYSFRNTIIESGKYFFFILVFLYYLILRLIDKVIFNILFSLK